MKPSKAADGVFDIREDEEQFEKLEHCLDLLVAAGYFRARVKGISAFDKIVGGMVWCISTLSYSIDVDLLFAENSSIGQKIALTEKIVQVLPRLQCPHSIEPHQIQGFDYIHVFPVIQWLVKRSCEAREERGDDLKRYASHMYNRKCSPQVVDDHLGSRLRELSSRVGAPHRQFRREEGAAIASLAQDIQYTLAEYDHARIPHGSSLSSYDAAYGEEKEPLQITTTKGRTKLSGRALKALVEDESMAEVFQELKMQADARKESVEETRKRELEVRREMEELERKHVRDKEEMAEEWEALKDKEQRIEHYKVLMEQFTQDELEELRHLVEEYSTASKGESEFKHECRDELAAMEREIEVLQQRIDSEDTVEDEESLAELQSVEAVVAALRQSTAAALRQLNELQHRMDELPSEAEIAQYHKRFIELGYDILNEHRRLSGAFDEHNTMVDVKEYLSKQNDLLNTVEEIVTESHGDYRGVLNDKLAVVLVGLEKTLDKLSSKDAMFRKESESLGKVMFEMREKERSYYRMVECVNEAYTRNAELRNELKKRGLEAVVDF